MTSYAAGSLVKARGREWVVLPESADDFLVLRPLGGGQEDMAGVFPAGGGGSREFSTSILRGLGGRAKRVATTNRASNRVSLKRRTVPLAGIPDGGASQLPARPTPDGAAP